MQKAVVACRSNEGYAASLEPRKLYAVIDDAPAREKGLLRVIDESGEDYLYPSDLFMQIGTASTASRCVNSVS